MGNPLASFENPSCTGNRPLVTGRQGTTTEKVEENTQNATLVSDYDALGSHSTNQVQEKALQPENSGVRTSFRAEVLSQERTIISGKENNEVQHRSGKNYT